MLEGEEAGEVRDQTHKQTHAHIHTGERVTTRCSTREARTKHLEGEEGWKHAKHTLTGRDGEKENERVNEEEMEKERESSSKQPLAGLESVCL